MVVDAHDRLQEVGVALRSANEPIDTSSASGRLIFQMLGSFAEFEKATINERTRDGKNRAYRGGAQPGLIPYGYDIVQDGSFVVVEEEGQVVRAIIRNIAHGATLFTEAKRLNLEGVPSPGKKYRGRPRRHGTTWSPMAISRIVGRRAYSGTHVIHSSAGEIEREVPPRGPRGAAGEGHSPPAGQQALLGGTARAQVPPSRAYPVRGVRLELQRRIAQAGGDTTTSSTLCPASSSRRFDPHAQRNGCPWLDALWLEGLVWQDIRTFVENPGEVLERVKEQMEEQQGQADEIEQRRASLAKRLAAVQGEKDKFVRLYAAGHLDDQELETHLLDLKNRISNLKLLIEAAEASLAREEQDAAAAKSTAAWLASLRERIEELEEDTEEAWQDRRELVEHLVERITVGRAEDGRAKVQIAYKFAPPVQPANGVTDNKTFEILSGETPIPEALGRL